MQFEDLNTHPDPFYSFQHGPLEIRTGLLRRVDSELPKRTRFTDKEVIKCLLFATLPPCFLELNLIHSAQGSDAILEGEVYFANTQSQNNEVAVLYAFSNAVLRHGSCE
jgi:hypothetical protein